MRASRTLLRATPARLVGLFVLLTGVPLVALGWLGWRVFEQDRALESQRARERLDNAASLLAGDLERSLAAWEALVTAPRASDHSIALPADSVLLIVDARGVVERQGVRLPYYPQVPASPLPQPATFQAVEALEFREQNLSQAADAYRVLTLSTDRSVRAAALVRLARVLRKQQQWHRALAVYDELARLGETLVAGSPAELVARRERSVLLKAIGDDQAAARETAELASALAEGRFAVDRATFAFFREAAAVEPVEDHQAVADSMRLAEAVDELWPVWLEQPRGRAAWTGQAGGFAAVWRPASSGTAAIVGTVESLLASTGGLLRSLRVDLVLEDPQGRRSWGDPPSAQAPQLTKTFRETGLPWTLHVAMADVAEAEALSASRRNLFSAGFALMALVIGSASYFVFRAVNRELGVARLQSEFVSAVSHEFRTPLTAMCHLTEMLEEGAVEVDRVPEYYRALAKESRRLHGMVESLLDFGRLDAGRRTYEFVEEDAAALVTAIVEEFRPQVLSTGHRLELCVPSSGTPERCRIRADRDSFTLALRNLLDNAVKYSPASSTVRVSMEATDGFVRIHVADEGAGLAKNERRDIFRKFTRGSSARTLNVKGTGIGLTMADEIVKAHGGRVEVVSEPNKGSTFSIMLPMQAHGSRLRAQGD